MDTITLPYPFEHLYKEGTPGEIKVVCDLELEFHNPAEWIDASPESPIGPLVAEMACKFACDETAKQFKRMLGLYIEAYSDLKNCSLRKLMDDLMRVGNSFAPELIVSVEIKNLEMDIKA